MEDEIGKTCIVFPRMGRVYNAFRGKLYTGESLYDGYDPEDEQSFATCFDSRVYMNYTEQGKHCDDIRETLGRSLHDHAISDAMYDFLSRFDEKQVVAVMGGHALLRTDEAYRNVAIISKTLTEKGKIMASGGGPGAMEATHFGAWMAGRDMDEFDDALEMISVAPSFRDPGWLRTSFEVRKRFPQKNYRSLGIPTWFYGHEPSTPFATDIAKFFFNSVREDTLLSIAKRRYSRMRPRTTTKPSATPALWSSSELTTTPARCRSIPSSRTFSRAVNTKGSSCPSPTTRRRPSTTSWPSRPDSNGRIMTVSPRGVFPSRRYFYYFS